MIRRSIPEKRPLPLAADAWGTAAPLRIAAAVVGLACAGTAAVPGVRRFEAHTTTAATTPQAAPGDTPGDTGRSKNVSSDTVA
ncbi:hypothetical protein [Streptomyces sp. NPDC055099]